MTTAPIPLVLSLKHLPTPPPHNHISPRPSRPVFTFFPLPILFIGVHRCSSVVKFLSRFLPPLPYSPSCPSCNPVPLPFSLLPFPSHSPCSLWLFPPFFQPIHPASQNANYTKASSNSPLFCNPLLPAPTINKLMSRESPLFCQTYPRPRAKRRNQQKCRLQHFGPQNTIPFARRPFRASSNTPAKVQRAVPIGKGSPNF